MLIPDHAKKVFEGVFFDVYHWQQEMYDGSKETYEAITRRLPGAQVICVQDDKILISHEQQSGRDKVRGFIGGLSEVGEEPLETAKREILEEAGVVSDDIAHYVSLPMEGRIMWTTHFFIARNVKKVQEQKLDVGEKIEIRKYTFDEFLDLIKQPDFRSKEFSFHLLTMNEEELASFKDKLFK